MQFSIRTRLHILAAIHYYHLLCVKLTRSPMLLAAMTYHHGLFVTTLRIWSDATAEFLPGCQLRSLRNVGDMKSKMARCQRRILVIWTRPEFKNEWMTANFLNFGNVRNRMASVVDSQAFVCCWRLLELDQDVGEFARRETSKGAQSLQGCC